METEDAGMMHNDTLLNPRAVRLQQVRKQDMKYPGPGLGDHLSFSHFTVSSLCALFPFTGKNKMITTYLLSRFALQIK